MGEQGEQFVVRGTIGDSTPFYKTIEAIGIISNVMTLTFDAAGLVITTTSETKKKKNSTIHFEARFPRWNMYKYMYNGDPNKSVSLKFEKGPIIDRIKPLKKELFGFQIRKNIQALYILLNEKGDDKLGALMESSVDTQVSGLTPTPEDLPLAWNTCKDYIDFCLAVKRQNPCEVKLETYNEGVKFLVTRYGSKDSASYAAGNIYGDKKAVYNLDAQIFMLIHSKVTKIVEETATIKFYVIPKAKDMVFVIELPIGVAGTFCVSYNMEVSA